MTLGEQLVALEGIDNIEDSNKANTEGEIVSANILSEKLVNLETKKTFQSYNFA